MDNLSMSGVKAPGNRSLNQPKRKAKLSTKVKGLIVGLIVLIILVLGGLFLWHNAEGLESQINQSEYQAVFFTNGQVYFGKLTSVSASYMKLTNVFYIQSSNANANSSNPQNAATSQSSNLQLIKLGSEIHGPEDAMVISKDQVLFFENLKNNGKISQGITQYYSKHQSQQ